MSKGIYIASTEPESGKLAAVLGVMELLLAQGLRVGFFRPVVRDTAEEDVAIRLMSTRYCLKPSFEAMCGCSGETANELIGHDRYQELHARILDKYMVLEGQHDLVVCVGTDYVSASPGFEFDFNVEVANNLGCPLLAVVKGLHRDLEQVGNAVSVLLASLHQKDCDLLAVIVNRTSPELIADAVGVLPQLLPAGVPGYVLPEHPLLGKPTVDQIAQALGAEWISGSEESRDREVANFKVAAMELPNFLNYVEEGSLIITPGDRADIVLGTLLADASSTYPHVAGLLLTGNLRPADQVQRLLSGLLVSSVPVFGVATDTFTTAMNVSAVEGTLLAASNRKISAALGVFEANVRTAELSERITGSHSVKITPLMFEHELIRRARSVRKHIVLPEGNEERILRAAEIICLRDIVDLTLLGKPDEVRAKISSLGLALERVNIIDPASSPLREQFADIYHQLRQHKGISRELAYDTMADVSYFGTMLVHQQLADGMVSGAVHTTQHTIRPGFEIIKTKPGCAIVSSVFFMCLADRVLVYGDCAVNPNPTAEQLADIAISSAETAMNLGIEPRVAMLSYSTGESGKGEDVERVRQATKLVRERRPELKIEGPIQYDAAVDISVAETKLPGSEVAGHATVFIFPDLNTGNNTYKAVQRSSGAVAIGPVLQGLNKPVNDLSRGCLVEDIVNTVAITAVQAQTQEGRP